MRRFAMMGLLLVLGACATLTPKGQGQSYVIFFEPFSAALDENAMGSIKAAAAKAQENATIPVTVAGYASPIGSAAANKDLAKTRAQVVYDGLINSGVPAARLKRKALGEVDYALDPIESRRVEISVGP